MITIQNFQTEFSKYNFSELPPALVENAKSLSTMINKQPRLLNKKEIVDRFQLLIDELNQAAKQQQKPSSNPTPAPKKVIEKKLEPLAEYKAVFSSVKRNEKGHYIPSSANNEAYYQKKAKEKGYKLVNVEFVNDLTDLYDIYFKLEKISKQTPTPKNQPSEKRIKQMVVSWTKEGRAFSKLDNDDKAFFNEININKSEVGITSQTGNDLLYYNTKMYASDSDAIKGRKISQKAKAQKAAPAPKPDNAQKVEKIDESVSFIKKYAALSGKMVNKEKALNLLKSLQKAILEKRIRKTNPFAAEIAVIQTQLRKIANTPGSFKIEIEPKALENYNTIAESEKVAVSIQMLKRFLSLQGKDNVKEKAKNLDNLISKYKLKGLFKNDLYENQVLEALQSLRNYITNKTKSIEVSDQQLNGLQGLGLTGVRKTKGKKALGNPIFTAIAASAASALTHKAMSGTKKDVMSINEIKSENFDTIGLDGDYLKLIGEACHPTSLFLYGIAGSGKSTMMLKMTRYFAEKGNFVAYVAGEQFGTPTFQQLINRLKLTEHPNFVIVRTVEAGLQEINQKAKGRRSFIVFDSKDSLKIDVEWFRNFQDNFPKISVIISSQSIGDGNFRGDKNWPNEVDTMIKVEKFKATTEGQKNRWGGSATINV